MWFYLLQGIGYGFAAAAQPGPFQTYLISQSLSKGWKQILPAALAPLVSDGPIITLCLLVLSQVPIWFQRFLYIAGGLFILFLAHGAHKAWKRFDVHAPIVESTSRQSILQAAMMNALSPGPYIFWSLVTGPILMRGWRETPVHGVGFMLGFYSAMILCLVTIILVFGIARELGPKVNRAMLGVSAAALLIFGIRQLWLGILG
jgi:threonine/homoserine/homoserine lactone efflux protein